MEMGVRSRAGQVIGVRNAGRTRYWQTDGAWEKTQGPRALVKHLILFRWEDVTYWHLYEAIRNERGRTKSRN